MHYHGIFLTSTTNYAQMPVTGKRLYPLVGRSNVGKSSLINMLVTQKQLAKTSGKPGKTSTINYFLVNNSWCFVDLPGYGWAQQSKAKRSQWAHMVENFVEANPYIQTVLLLVDARHPPQTSDCHFLDFLIKRQIPCALVFTKVDKAKQVLTQHIAAHQARLAKQKVAIPFFSTSAKTKQGRESLLRFIEGEARTACPITYR